MTKQPSTDKTAPGGFRFKLLSKPFEQIVQNHGWNSNAEIAEAVYLSERQVRRIRNRRTPPGIAFVAGLRRAAPEADLWQVFEVVSTDQPAENEE
jgi:hypothetical protein